MKRILSHTNSVVLLLVGTCFLVNCSSQKTNIISTTYHNTTAHYNAYYYANERIKEIQELVNEGKKDNYDDILNIYHSFDTATSNSYKKQTEDCIKKASIAIQMHGNSKWKDDSYVLIGLARYYDSDFVNAIETFKYVNTKSEDPKARHRALAHLLRVFTDYKEYNNAEAVIDYLKKEEINNQNRKILYLNKAHLYQTKGNIDKVVKNLVEAAPLLSRKEGKARIYFIIGQIYQRLGFDSEAYNNYKQCLSHNPKYELFFYAKLNMAQVADFKKASDIKSIRKHFRQLLNDKKNKEFRDKIFYEMGEFDFKNNNIQQAISYYEQSAAASINNNRQKGISYLKLGKIYYDTLKKYPVAKAYYDSTIQVLPKEYPGYEKINARKDVLDNFVKQLTTIQLQDSLLRLAGLDSAEVMAQITQQIEKEDKDKKKKEERKKRKLNNVSTYVNPFDTGNTTGGRSWYFGNPVAVSQGVSEFKRKWGNRNLEDHWRRSTRPTPQIEDDDVNENSTNTDPQKTLIDPNAASTELSVSDRATNRYNQIPWTDQSKQESLNKIETAYYKLGSIYHFDLFEKQNAITSFNTLLERFPTTEYEPEVRYLLYILDSTNSSIHKNQLLAKFPKSTYAKLISNPNYTEESNETTTILKKIYKTAFELYKKREYKKARTVLVDALRIHQETSFTPQMKLLNIMLTSVLESQDKYKYELVEFIKEYPDIEITNYARQLEKSIIDYQTRIEKSSSIQFITDFAQPHYFVMIYDSDQNITEKITEKLKSFNLEYYEKSELKTGSLTLNQASSIALVTEFKGIEAAVSYLTKYDEGRKTFDILSKSKIDTFVITKDNFGILYKSGGVKEYLKFFKQYY